MATHQFMLRIPEAAVARLEQIAIERGFTGGQGRHGKDEPNKAAAARWLLGQADEAMFAAIFDEAPERPLEDAR